MIEMFPSEIAGHDFKLVKLAPTTENLQIIFNIIRENYEEFRPWLEWVDFVKKPEDEMSVLEDDQNSGKAEWFIQFDNRIVGRIGFVSLSRSNNRGEIGDWLDKRASGYGIMTKAFSLIEKNAFENWGFNRIQLKIDPENAKSLGVARRMNYKQEGILRQEHFIHNVYKDSILFSKLKSEYEAK